MIKFCRFNSRSGQSLIEVMIGLAIGSLLIGTASLGVAFILRSSSSNQNLQTGAGLNQDIIDKVRGISSANWQDVYSLTKGTSSSYFVYPSGTSLFVVVGGREGVFQNEISNGLIGEWKFDEATSSVSTTTFDSTGNNNSGILTNGPLRASSTCKASACLSFDGDDDYVNVSSLTYSNNVTMSVWFKGGSQTASDWNYWIRSGNIVFEFGTYGDGITFKDNIASGTPSVSGGTTFVDNEWHHAVGVVSSTEMQIWVDGVLRQSRTDYPGGQSHTSVNHRIGGNGTSPRGWSGFIDDARIYNRALTPAEILTLYNNIPFTRYFHVENVTRDSSGDIASGNDDPATQKITAYAEWAGQGALFSQLKVLDYITRWQNSTFNQSDWSGGSGESGVLTQPSNKYTSSSNIDATSTYGSIKILGL
ncbi:MAG: LamG-like jellyroll fold domain-containing protein [Patescibacteria group bacterium]